MNTKMQFFENLICKKRLAEILGMSTSFVNKWMRRGLPYYKVGGRVRFNLDEVLVWLERRHFQ
ncbi:MAG: helix-turn-helix domain-containing protein [Oligoflexales bacterium]